MLPCIWNYHQLRNTQNANFPSAKKYLNKPVVDRIRKLQIGPLRHGNFMIVKL